MSGEKIWKLKPYKKRPLGGTETVLTPDELWKRACEYFDWCGTAYLEETKMFSGGDAGVIEGQIKHKRPFTIAGLSLFVGIGRTTWDNYCKRPEFMDVCETIDAIMYDQKFSGAAVGLYNARIISRDLGLVEKSESDMKSSDGSMTPGKVVAITDMTDDELLAIVNAANEKND